MRLRLPLTLLLFAVAGCGSPSPTNSGAPATGTENLGATTPGGVNHVHSIAIVPKNPRVLYVGTHYHLYKSSNGGSSWKALSSDMVLSMALDPAHPSTIYSVSLQHGLQRTRDGGLHWTSPTHSIPKGNAVGVALDPTSGVVLAYGAGIYRGSGSTFTHTLVGKSVTSVAVGSPGVAYAATDSGLFVTRDDGARWRSVSDFTNQPIIQVAAAGPIAYAVTPLSLVRSANKGASWQTVWKAPQNIQFIGVAPSNPDELLAEVSSTGFVATDNGGKTWHKANRGIGNQDFNAATVRVAPTSPKVVYAGSWGVHFFASTDGGKHWSLRSTLSH